MEILHHPVHPIGAKSVNHFHVLVGCYFFFNSVTLGGQTGHSRESVVVVVVRGHVQIEWQGSVAVKTGLSRGGASGVNPGDLGVFLNDVFAQANGDTLHDYVADQTLVAPICQLSTSHISFLLRSSDARFLFATSMHSLLATRDCRSHSGNSVRLERRGLGQIRRRSPLTVAFNQWESYFGDESEGAVSREEVVFFMSCTIIE